jgi:hypothetical protein
VKGRLRWLSSSYDRELTDKIYLNAGEVDYEYGATVRGPSVVAYRVFYVAPGHAEQLATLVSQYESKYCSDR